MFPPQWISGGNLSHTYHNNNACKHITALLRVAIVRELRGCLKMIFKQPLSQQEDYA
jgi:hypothetical protein